VRGRGERGGGRGGKTAAVVVLWRGNVCESPALSCVPTQLADLTPQVRACEPVPPTGLGGRAGAGPGEGQRRARRGSIRARTRPAWRVSLPNSFLGARPPRREGVRRSAPPRQSVQGCPPIQSMGGRPGPRPAPGGGGGRGRWQRARAASRGPPPNPFHAPRAREGPADSHAHQGRKARVMLCSPTLAREGGRGWRWREARASLFLPMLLRPNSLSGALFEAWRRVAVWAVRDGGIRTLRGHKVPRRTLWVPGGWDACVWRWQWLISQFPPPRTFLQRRVSAGTKKPSTVPAISLSLSPP